MRKPVILLDVDGPLTEGFMEQMCVILRDEGIEEAYPHFITDWDVCKGFGVPHSITTRAYERMREPGVCLGFRPNEGAREFVENIRRWAKVLAVTAPLNGSPTWAQEREVWLTDHLDFKVEEVISARDKTHVYGDILVDDKVKTIRSWAARWHGSEGILYNESYNVMEAWNPRAGDYFDLLGLLAPLKEKALS